jgi:hypothetical protein
MPGCAIYKFGLKANYLMNCISGSKEDWWKTGILEVDFLLERGILLMDESGFPDILEVEALNRP